MRRLALCFGFVVLAILSQVAAVAPPPAEPPEVAAWVADLASDDIAVRRAAMRKLEGLGPTVIPALRRVDRRSTDADVRLRAAVVIAAIQEKRYGVVRRYVCPGGGVLAFALSPDGRRVAAGGNTVIHVWEVETGKELFQMKGHTAAVYALDWSRDGKRILSGAIDNSLRLWDAETGKSLKTMTHENGVVNAVFTADGKRAVAIGYQPEVCFWDLETGKKVLSNTDHRAGVRGLALFSDGKTVATAGFDGTVRLLDVETGKQRLLCKTKHTQAWFVAASPDGKRVASSGADGLVLLHDAETGELVKTFRGHAGGVHGVAFSSDGRRILSGGGNDHTGRVWDVASGKEIQRLYDHEQGVLCVAFLPGDRRAMTACFDRTVRLWSLRE